VERETSFTEFAALRLVRNEMLIWTYQIAILKDHVHIYIYINYFLNIY